MIDLSLESINSIAFYEVRHSRDGFEFTTNSNIRYRIRFIEDNPIGGCETYQFAITKVDSKRSGYDANVRQTTLAMKFAKNAVLATENTISSHFLPL